MPLCQLLASTSACSGMRIGTHKCIHHIHTRTTLIFIPISQNTERKCSLLWIVQSPAVLKGAEDPLPSPKHGVTSEQLLMCACRSHEPDPRTLGLVSTGWKRVPHVASVPALQWDCDGDVGRGTFREVGNGQSWSSPSYSSP